MTRRVVPVYARIRERNLTGSRVLLLPGLTLVPRSYSQHAIGGPLTAEVDVYGDATALREVSKLVRHPIELIADGEIVWWGMVNASEIVTPTARIGTSLDGMYNRVFVNYTTPGTPLNPSGERLTTPLAEDDVSVAQYGVKALRTSISNATTGEALARRDRILAARADPVETSTPLDGDEMKASLYCVGWWSTLAWRYYILQEGLLGYEEQDGYDNLWTLAIGEHWYTNTTISFVEAGPQMAVEDSAHTLAFRPRSHVNLWVNGVESGRYVLASRHDDGGQFLLANPGNVYVHQRLQAGPTVAIHPYGREVAISFSHAWPESVYLARVKLVAAKEGAALADAMQVELRADTGGGLPAATALATATVDHALLSESYTWVDFDFGSTVELLPSTRYWLVVTRSVVDPLTDGVNFYMMQINERANYVDPGALGGSLLVNHTTDAAGTSHAWQVYTMPHAPLGDALFVVEGSRETTIQLARLFALAGDHLAGSFIETPSGVYTSPYRDTDTTAQEVAEELLASGTANQRRLLARVDRLREVHVYEEPTSGSGDWLLASDGSLRDRFGVEVPASRCPVGFWLRVQDVTAVTSGGGQAVGPGRFVERATYDCESGVYRPEGRTPPAPWEDGF